MKTFQIQRKKSQIFLTSMVEYSKRLKKIVPIIKPLEIKKSLGEILSKNNLRQLRITETEKYAHVTYFSMVVWKRVLIRKIEF